MKRALPEARDSSDRQVLRDVAESGCHIVGVLADETEPAFAYSIGLFHNFSHPEIVVFGLPQDVMPELINAMCEGIQNGRRYSGGSKYSDLIDGFDCELLTVHPSHYRELFGYARWLYDGDDFPALQCFWPDKKGSFPWQVDFDSKLKHLQPMHNKSA